VALRVGRDGTERVTEDVAGRGVALEPAGVVHGGEQVTVAAWFSPPVAMCGQSGIFHAPAMCAMRSTSVGPPDFDRSGWKIPTLPSSSRRWNSKRP
jgi:hypothetical protein